MRIIPNQGVCDPHIHIFEGKAWLFSSHDRGPGMPIYRMDDWQVFSSDDLLNLGKPLLPKGLVDTACYDPTVFIDDDEEKTPYIIFGYTVFGKKYYIARLNDDMISLAEEPRPIEIENSWQNDATWLTKRNGVYYLNSHGSEYATSDNIYGPYTYRGNFCHDAYVDHGTFFTYHNQTYFTYGVPENWGSENVDKFYRTTKIIYAHYKDNGDIVIDEFIQDAGVGQYDASWEMIKGEWFFASSDSIYKKENTDGFDSRYSKRFLSVFPKRK